MITETMAIIMIEEAQLSVGQDDGKDGGEPAPDPRAAAVAGLLDGPRDMPLDGPRNGPPNGPLDALPLMVWLSPAFPVGSFAFSHGIEWAVQAGDVRDAETTARWIGGLLAHGGLRNDCVLAAAAWRAVSERDGRGLGDVVELALALAGSRERHLETAAQGNAFLVAVRAAWETSTVDWAADVLAGREVAYPVAVGSTASAHGIALLSTLEMFALAVVQNLVSATIRLSTLGHTDGQRVIAALLPETRRLAQWASLSTLDDLGGSVFRSDLAALRHETQYTRLFRS